MADKLLIVMMNSNPDDASDLVSPISQAIVAAAMGFEVEMIFTGRCTGVLKKGAAAQIRLAADKVIVARADGLDVHVGHVAFLTCVTHGRADPA